MNFKKINQVKAGVVLTYLYLVSGFIISILYTPLMIRLLGQSEYGVYNLVAAVISYLGVMNFGLGSSYIKFYTKYKRTNDETSISRLNGMFLLVFGILGLITVISGIILSSYSEIIFGSELTTNEHSIARVLLIILSLNLGINFLDVLFISYIRANEKFVFQKLVSLIKTFINPFLIIPILLMGYGSIGMAIGITVLSLLTSIVHMIFSFRKLSISISISYLNLGLFKELFVFSFFIFLHIIVDQINWSVDKYIIGRFHGSISVAIYSLATTFNIYFLQLATAVSNVFVPRIHKMVNSGLNTEISNLFTRIGRIQFILLSLAYSGFILFGKQFIYWWAGEEYTASYYIIIVLVGAVIIDVIQNIGIEIQRAMNLHKFRAYLYLLIALINVVITIPLVIKYNGIGGAVGTAFALVIGNGVIMNIYYKTKMGIDIKKFWLNILRILPAFILPMIYGVLYLKYFDISQILGFLIGIFSYSLVFGGSMWIFGMNNFEKKLVVKPIKFLYSKLIKR